VAFFAPGGWVMYRYAVVWEASLPIFGYPK